MPLHDHVVADSIRRTDLEVAALASNVTKAGTETMRAEASTHKLLMAMAATLLAQGDRITALEARAVDRAVDLQPTEPTED